MATIGVCVFCAAASVVALFYFFKKAMKMEIIGIKREMDSNGRVCIPKEMRDIFKLYGKVEILPTTEGILIRNPKFVLVKKEN